MKIKKISQSAGVIADVIDSLNSTSTLDALSANQGRFLNEKIDNLELPDTTVIEDNLTSTSVTSALSANQGKVLNERITNNEIFLIKKASDYGNQLDLYYDEIFSDFTGKVGYIINDMDQVNLSNANSYRGDIFQISVQAPYGSFDLSQIQISWIRENNLYSVIASNVTGSWEDTCYYTHMSVKSTSPEPT